MSNFLVETKNLKMYFKVKSGWLHAVDDISFGLPAGKTLGVVGESGCGKSTLGSTLLRLYDPTAGQILFDGQDISRLGKRSLKSVRKDMQMIFQDPYSSLNSRMPIHRLTAEPMLVNKTVSGAAELRQRVSQLMDIAGLAPRLANAYVHELDGGRRQRIGIARALALNPRFIVCDEPVSALDVSIQAQILNLLMDLQEQMGLTYLFITHDLSVVRHISSDIMVMYLGKCVETAPARELFKNPAHPYTQALLSALPIPDYRSRHRRKKLIAGEVVSPINPPPGCRFSARCPMARPECSQADPPMVHLGAGHYAACFKVANHG